MIVTGLIITAVAIAIGIAVNRLIAADQSWFFKLRRPDWLTFEQIIPIVWISIFICGIISANYVWHADPHGFRTWLLLAGYAILEISIVSYTQMMSKLQSVTVGVVIGGTGFVIGLILALFVLPVSRLAFGLLVPYLLWSPFGTYITWEMMWLNPGKR